MAADAVPVFTRFRWSALNRRARRRLAAGFVLLLAALAYAWFAGFNMARRGADERALDQPLQVSKTVTVAIIGDTLVEPDETLHLNLTSPVNATLLESQGTGTIRNNDG